MFQTGAGYPYDSKLLLASAVGYFFEAFFIIIVLPFTFITMRNYVLEMGVGGGAVGPIAMAFATGMLLLSIAFSLAPGIICFIIWRIKSRHDLY